MSLEERTDAEKALQLVTEERVALLVDKTLIDFYWVRGMTNEYLVIYPNFCTCEHFILRSLKSAGSICYHILAVKMAHGRIKKTKKIDWIKLLLKKR